MERVAVHFGAGNIGRGFIGMLLAQAGYRVVFVDVAENLVTEIQKRGSYTVEVAGETLASVRVDGVEACFSSDKGLPEILAAASLITTAVGANVLIHVAKSIVAGFAHRKAGNPNQYIIACENMMRGSSCLKRAVEAELCGQGLSMAANVYFPDAAVDRVVPALSRDEARGETFRDPLIVRVEQYHEWLVEGTAGQYPELAGIEGLHLVEDLTPFLKRKIYTVNTGHACAAWHGFRLGYKSVNDALTDHRVREMVAGVLAESSKGLCAEYGLDPVEQKAYCEKVLKRFQNPFIIDDVLRVGREPLRKLSAEERIDGPLQLAGKHGGSVVFLLRSAAAALLFRNREDSEACELESQLENQGLTGFLSEKLTHLGCENLEKVQQYYLEYQVPE
ncbi:mannitol-1-phosphate 5-dehydrogenase [Candidatus Haliotispira prima]|uniref:Mannitol-1-phosphate 5-dehydrogenase n=1 Tax=Candidatus Haliotispira prima TaxID=3034016 RepID=A0ABY8MH39_9SPIO|nr:mannitol-1-phosphate 5-dehydrogenase [Candidatus Haliotispira prima]